MSYRSILLHLDQSAGSDARTRAAIRLAQRLNCHLAGLAPTGLLDLPGVPGGTLGVLARSRGTACATRPSAPQTASAMPAAAPGYARSRQ
ncbi:hypothetical protein [Rhizobacter sp. OV335]|jgi:hypothetical protein|uniref:hypothetical protein n=1 Tax=Rhizobacter sp. OV335 TaxID=1500264 RepID=UPI00091DE057|nr:hypothetical protein [Rhizobacter sp. OV335]SHN38002.1 hypothetical protein SAMN02787076_05826 [Rhizobacter sp. OV335]